RGQQLVARGCSDDFVEARVFVRVRLAGGDSSLLRGEDLRELDELRLRDALRGERRDRGLDEPAKLDHVGKRVPARHEARERTSEIVRRRLPHERAPTGSGLHDAEELERAESLADRSARYLQLLSELSLRWKLVPRAQLTSCEESLDLLDDALVAAAPADRPDDCRGAHPPPDLPRSAA